MLGALLGIIALACLLGFMLTDIPRCERCGTGWGVARRHMGTAYVDRESNYCVQCPKCYADTEEHWREMWTMYWGMVR